MMPMPSEIKERRAYAQRRALEKEVLKALVIYKSVVGEVFGSGKEPSQLFIPIFEMYCKDIQVNNIKIEPGEIEPHAMYLRAYMKSILIKLKSFVSFEVYKTPDGMFILGKENDPTNAKIC